jgi:OOP family OmpA-OmpF porin
VTLQGSVPDEETATRIIDAVRRLHAGSTIINDLSVGEVAGPAWLDSIGGLLDVVTRLDPWTLDISGGQVTITGLTLDVDFVAAIDVLTEEVVAGQLAVSIDIQLDPAAVAIELTSLVAGTDLFEPNTANLTAGGLALLDQAIDILEASPLTSLIIAGHTDDRGAEADNLALSQQQADAVVAYLVAGGIDPGRLTAVGYGETLPIADNVTDEGRAQNRRIEFVQEGDG